MSPHHPTTAKTPTWTSPGLQSRAVGSRRLVVQGDIEAAALPDGAWGDGTWTATGVDGEPVELRSRGYTHPEWRAAHQAMVRAALRQAIGRARAGLVEGIPCVVLSDEPLGLPVDRRPVLVHRKPARRVLEALRGIQAAAQAAHARGEAEFTVETLVAGGCAKNSPPMPIRYRNGAFTLIGIGGELVAQTVTAADSGFVCVVPPAVISAAAGVPRGRITEAITDLAAAGDIHQPEPGYWALGAAPTEPGTVYARVLPVGREAGATGLGRPPETVARATAAQDAVAQAAATGNGLCTTGQFVAAEAAIARRTAMMKLADAVQAGAVVQLGRGKYVPGPGALHVAADGRSAVQWGQMQTDAGPVPVEITHTITSPGGLFVKDFTPPNAAQLAALAEWRKKPIERRT